MKKLKKTFTILYLSLSSFLSPFLFSPMSGQVLSFVLFPVGLMRNSRRRVLRALIPATIEGGCWEAPGKSSLFFLYSMYNIACWSSCDGWIVRWATYTAKKKYRNFETNIPRKGISGSQSQFPHSCVCERFIYSHDRSPYSAGGNI